MPSQVVAVPFVDEPTVPDDPSQAILSLSTEIRDAIENCRMTEDNKRLSLKFLSVEAKERQMTLLVRGAMETIGFRPQDYEQCLYDTVKKAIATKLLDTQNLSRWAGKRWMTTKLQEMSERTKLNGKQYCLEAASVLCFYILVHFRDVRDDGYVLSRLMTEQQILLKLPTAIKYHGQVHSRRTVSFFEVSRRLPASVDAGEAVSAATPGMPSSIPPGPSETHAQVRDSQVGAAVAAQKVEPKSSSASPCRAGSDGAKPVHPAAVGSNAEANGSAAGQENATAGTETRAEHEAFLHAIMELCTMNRQLNEEHADPARMVKAHKANARLSQGIVARLGGSSMVQQDYQDLVHHLGPAFEASAEETGDLVDFFHRAKNCDVASSTTKCLAHLVVAVRRLRQEPTDELLDLVEGKIRTLTDAIGSAEYSLRLEKHVRVSDRDLRRQVDDEVAAATGPTLPSTGRKRPRDVKDGDLEHDAGEKKRHHD